MSVSASANDNQSSHGGSGAGSSLVQVGTNSKDDMETGRGASFWNNVFGALYTVNKERETSAVFFAIKTVMEFLQLFVLMLGVQYGWQFDTNSKAWQFVQFLQVRPFLTDIGHGLFLMLFLGFIILLATCLAIYTWVYFCFQNNKFDYVWPLRLVRLFGAFFFETMDIMVMALMLSALDCRYYGWPDALRMFNNEFPDRKCSTAPDVIFFILGLLAMLVYVTLAGFTKLAQMDLNPATRNLDAYAHPVIELWGFAIKVLMVAAGVFLGDYRHLAIAWFICSVMLCFFFWKWEPMVVPWVNYLRMGTYTAAAYVSCLFMALQYPPDAIKAAHRMDASAPSYVSYVKGLEVALVGVLPLYALGAAASYLRLRYFRVTVVNRFRSAPLSAKERGIHKFRSPREVEVVSRCCRAWVDCDTLQPEAVALAERVVKAGMACLPNSPFMVVWYTSYLVDVQGSYQSGFLQLQVALKLDPSFIDKYAIFSREQDHATKLVNGGHGQNDALMDVEFQKNYRLAMFAHKEVLSSIRAFWQLLLHAKVRFEDLTRATKEIDHVIKHAERTYRSVLQRHADQPRLLRLYAKFLERVKHDPWAASKWTIEADKLEALKVESRHTNMLGLDEDGGDIGSGRISLFSVAEDGQERALCVFNPQGIMTMTNEAMRDTFGYAKAELKGKSVSVLLPPAFAEQQIQQVKSFVVSGRGAVVMRTCEVVAVRKDRSMFGARITVVRIAGIGEDSTFLASFEAVPVEASTATVWLLARGQVLSVDSRFRDWFGFRPTDLEGGATSSWTPSSKQLDDVLRAARHAMILASQAAMIAAAQDSADEDVDDPTVQLLARGKSLATADRLDSVAAALAAAAAAAPAAVGSTPGIPSEWILKGVRVAHKFSDPVEVEIKVANSRPSAFCMHVLSVRRAGIAAAKPMPHMVVTTPQGPVLHVTEGFAALLGTSPKVLMANGSPTAMEALMVPPFGMMHRAGLSGSMPSQQPPSYSCRSGLSVLMPVAGSASLEAMPFKMQMKKRVNLDEVHYVCTLEQTSWEQALDERSLRVCVDEAGVVTEVGPSPASLFGFIPAVLVGHNVACFVVALRGETGTSEAPGAAPLLVELAARSQLSAPGTSWRVSVGISREEDVEAALLSPANAASAAAPLQPTKMLAAVMTLVAAPAPRPRDPKAAVLDSAAELPPAAPLVAGGGSGKVRASYELRLWRADMVTSVIEVDGSGIIVETEHYLDKLYPAGAALGVGGAFMLGNHIRNFLPLGDHKFDDLSDDTVFPLVPVRGAHSVDLKKKSNMRTTRAPADRQRVGPPVLLHGRHRLDGADLTLSVQLVRKGGGGAYLVLHPVQPLLGNLDFLSDRSTGRERLYDVDLPPMSPLLPRHMGQDSARGSSSQVPLLLGHSLSTSSRTLPTAAGGALVLLTHQQQSAAKPPSNLSRASLEGGRRPNMAAIMRASQSVGDVPAGSMAGLLEEDAPQAVAASLPRVECLAQPGITVKSVSRSGSTNAANVSAWVMTDGTAALYSPPRGPAELLDDMPGGYDDDDPTGLFPNRPCGLSDDGMPATMSEDELRSAAAEDSARDYSASGGGGSGGGRRGKNKGGNESDGSLLDEAENAADTDADYRRGQRVKKLGRILNNEAVAANSRQLKYSTFAITFLLAAVSVAVYTLYTFLLSRQILNVQGLYLMGNGARKMMRCVTTVLDMGMLYQPYPNPYLSPGLAGMSNTGSDLDDKKADISAALELVATSNLGTFSGFLGFEQRMPVAYGLRALWETPTLDENFFALIPSTENNTNAYTTITPNAAYVQQTFARKISLFDGVNRMVANTREIVAKADWYNSTMCTIFAGAVAWINWTSVLYVRNNTNGVYLDGWMRTLDGYAQVVIAAARQLNTVQVIVLLVQGVLLSTLAELCLWYLCNKVDKNRHRIYSVFVAVPMTMVRVLATQNISLDAAEGSDDEADDIALLKGAGGASGPSIAAREGDAGGKSGGGGGGVGGGGGGKGVHINIAGETTTATASGRFAPPPTFGGRVAAALCFWRSSKVVPSSGRRTLSRSLRGVLWLTWPFFVWGVGILILNIVGHSLLQTVTGPVMTFNTVNFFMCRSWRVLASIQSIQFDANPLASAASLKVDLVAAQVEYRALLYGYAGVPDQTTPHFLLITNGIATQSGAGQEILYVTRECLADTPSGCLSTTDPYYQYTSHGLDVLVRHFFDVVLTIIQVLEGGVIVTNQGPEMQFMFKIRESMTGGTNKLVSAYKTYVQNVYSNTLMLQTVALVWTLVVMLLYLVFILRPYLNEVSTETRRITELLTQLPVDIDVEGLVQRVLLASGGGGKGRTASAAPAGPFHASVAPLPQPPFAAVAQSGSSRALLLGPIGKPPNISSLRHFNVQTLAAQEGVLKGGSGAGDRGSSNSLISPFLRDAAGSSSGRQLGGKAA